MKSIDILYVIDDDEVFQYIVKRQFENTLKVKRITFFADGKEAIKALEDNSTRSTELPDVILLDINMPVMDGWDFLKSYRTVKSSLAKLPLIYLVTTSLAENDKKKAKEFEDVTGYIVKPVKKEELDTIFSKVNNN
jgi:CheY-like chemotaxis protein